MPEHRRRSRRQVQARRTIAGILTRDGAWMRGADERGHVSGAGHGHARAIADRTVASRWIGSLAIHEGARSCSDATRIERGRTMADRRTLRAHLETEAGLTKLFAFVFLVIVADCMVTAYGLLAQ